MTNSQADKRNEPWGDPIHGDGVFQCNGCGRTYPEYINGCVEDHDRPRKVVLVIPEGKGGSDDE